MIWIPIEGVLRLGGHVLRGSGESYTAEPGQEIPDEHKEVSAVMLKLRAPRDGMLLDQAINRQGKVATLAWPIGKVMAELFDKLGWLHRVLELVALLVVAVAAGTILASIHNSMNERRREFAILRALGARRRTVFGVIVCEAGVIALLGSLLGYAVYAAILGTAALIVRARDRSRARPHRPAPGTVDHAARHDRSRGALRAAPGGESLPHRRGRSPRPPLLRGSP